MSYISQFHDFGRLDVQLPAGFVDVSDKTNAMPTFEKALENGNIIRIWIDFKDKARSKYPNDPRFVISIYNSSRETLHDDIQSDKWHEILLFIRGLEEYHSVRKSHR